MDFAKDDEGVDPATAFAALSDPVRVGILEALADRYRHNDRTVEPGLPFSVLRKRVGVRDSGRFRYHLEKLRDTFVAQTDDGRYRLTYAGTEVVTAIVAGTYTNSVTLGPTDIDSTCGSCGASAVGTYDDGVLSVRCGNDHQLFLWSLPPNAARGTIEELLRTATIDLYQTVELTRAGICPDCYASVETYIEPSEGVGQPYRFRAHCETCGSTLDGPIGFCLVGHPDVDTLYHRHDQSICEGYWWELEFVQDDVPINRLADDPLCLRLLIRVGDETLRATINETGRVVTTETTNESDHA